MKKFKAIWELMRLEHGLMIFIAILIGALISLKGETLPTWDKLILTFFTALFLVLSKKFLAGEMKGCDYLLIRLKLIEQFNCLCR